MSPDFSFDFTLPKGKKLLAFSAGIDSSALFFILKEKNIDFDIIIVDYALRQNSILELNYAKELAKKYSKKIFTIKYPKTNKFSEKNARDFRYEFFDKIIKEYSYDFLLTAHQLNDKLEWFLMQMTKGAGLCELLGLERCKKKDGYMILRPLLEFSKEDLHLYLLKNKLKFYYDESNDDTKYKRNYFRKNFANGLLKNFQSGIKNTFSYLEKDLKTLNLDEKDIFSFGALKIFTSLKSNNLDIRIIDKELKKRGYLLSKNQRLEIFKQGEINISDFSISLSNNLIWICPSCLSDAPFCVMDKKFKEFCRIKKIPKKQRQYIFKQKSSLDFVKFKDFLETII